MNQLKPGTMCGDCGCCEAVSIVLKEPLCRACRMGFPLCEKKRRDGMNNEALDCAVYAMGTLGARKLRSDSGKSRGTKPAKLPPLPQPGEPRRTGMGIKTPEDIRAAIAAEDPAVRTQDVADKYGVSCSTANIIRRRAGRVVALEARKLRSDSGQSRGTKPEGKEVSHVKPMEADMEDGIEKPVIQPKPQPESMQTVTLQFSAEQLDAIWGKLSTDVKAIAIQGVLQAWV